MAKPGRILPLAVRQTIKEMRSGGVTVRKVAEALNINRNTACKYGRTLGQNDRHGTENR